MILPTGTKVVLKAPLAGAAQHVYPPGTLGVIVETPVDASHSYRLRLVDGFEAQLTRSAFTLLNTLQREGLEQSALADYELSDCVIYRCLVGSRAYGLANDESDSDLRGVYLAPAERHWSLFGVPEQLENKDADEVYWELQKFLVLALKANPNILEVLFSPEVLHETEIATRLLAMKQSFLSKLVYQTYCGYVMSQFKKMQRRREAEREPKWKHAMHLIRLLLSGIATLRTGVVPVRVTDEHRARLLEIREGKVAFEDIDAWRLELHRDFEEAFANTELPERPDYGAANRFLIEARREAAQ